MDFASFHLEKANYEQSQAISDLVNSTYRGEIGWTTEINIVQGHRTSRQEIETVMSNPNGYFLIVRQQQILASCIYLSREKDHAYIGFFSVHPNFQGKGLGKRVLQQAEEFAMKHMGMHRFIIFVISQRLELIAFYERRGYSRTGRIEDYPLSANIGEPKIAGLTIEYLEKIT